MSKKFDLASCNAVLKQIMNEERVVGVDIGRKILDEVVLRKVFSIALVSVSKSWIMYTFYLLLVTKSYLIHASAGCEVYR